MPAPDPARVPDRPTEAHILSLYAQHPSRGFDAFHQTYLARIRTFIRRMLSGYSASEREELLPDILQETLLALHERLTRPDELAPGYSLDAQVFLTCRGKVLDTLRRHKRRNARELFLEPEVLEQQGGAHQALAPEGQALMQELLSQLDDCLKLLTERARVVVVRTSQGYSNPEIQAEAGIPHASTVCKTRDKAHAQLKECLETFETEAHPPGLPSRRRWKEQ